MMKKTLLSLSLVGLMLGTVPALANDPVAAATSAVANTAASGAKTFTAKKVLSVTAWVTFFLMAARFWTREPDKNPSRYNLDELMAGQNIGKNAWYLIDDGIIGHQRKDNTLKADAETGKIYVGNKIAPKGFGGYFHSYLKPILTAVGTAIFVKAIFDTAAMMDGKQNVGTKFEPVSVNEKGKLVYAAKEYTKDFVTRFFETIAKKASSIVKLSDIGNKTVATGAGALLVK